MGERFPVEMASLALAEAHGSLQRGCAFLVARRNWPLPDLSDGELRVELRRAGNCLRELDRFLCLLLDACAAASMGQGALLAFERSHDAARKWRRIVRSDMEAQRLEAIARLRRTACGEQRGTPRAAPARDLALATAGLAQAPAAPLRLGEDSLAAIALFYLELADGLVARYAARPQFLLHGAGSS
jgi:hypothetical protein